jgi:hypothetical protein
MKEEMVRFTLRQTGGWLTGFESHDEGGGGLVMAAKKLSVCERRETSVQPRCVQCFWVWDSARSEQYSVPHRIWCRTGERVLLACTF